MVEIYQTVKPSTSNICGLCRAAPNPDPSKQKRWVGHFPSPLQKRINVLPKIISSIFCKQYIHNNGQRHLMHAICVQRWFTSLGNVQQALCPGGCGIQTSQVDLNPFLILKKRAWNLSLRILFFSNAIFMGVSFFRASVPHYVKLYDGNNKLIFKKLAILFFVGQAYALAVAFLGDFLFENSFNKLVSFAEDHQKENFLRRTFIVSSMGLLSGLWAIEIPNTLTKIAGATILYSMTTFLTSKIPKI